MIIGGLQKFTLIDYPGKIGAVIFTRGCNFRCRYCHNPELVIPEKYTDIIPNSFIYNFLKARVSRLDGIIISGGEPTIQDDLIDFIKAVRDLGFYIKIDTNGSNPDILKTIIDKKLVDYIAMDIKAPLNRYFDITGYRMPAAILKKSIRLIMDSGIEYEFRTTVLKNLISESEVKEIAGYIKGAEKYYIQRFTQDKIVDNSLKEKPDYSEGELESLAAGLGNYFGLCGIR